MKSQIIITLQKAYTVQVDDFVGESISSFAKLIDFLANHEFNSLSIQFSTVNNEILAQRQQKNCLKRINKLASELDMQVAFVENKVVDGHEFPNHFVGALIGQK